MNATIEFFTYSDYADGRTLANVPDNMAFDTLEEAIAEFDTLKHEVDGEYVAQIWLGDAIIRSQRITL